MTSSDRSGQNEEREDTLASRLINLGRQEIYLWKEMVVQDPSLFPEIYDLIFSDQPRVAWHAAWVIDHVSWDHPDLMASRVPDLIARLGEEKRSQLKRHLTRMLLKQQIPNDSAGRLIDILYSLLSPSEDVAVRANAMQLLYQMSLVEPGLKQELILVLEDLSESGGSAGILAKSGKLLRSLRSGVPENPKKKY